MELQNIDTIQFLKCLKSLNFDKVYIQIGKGKYEPKIIIENAYSNKISIEYFRFTEKMEDYILKCDLIISHCGAGSILEVITKKKQLIVVINYSLQDNHQTELSDVLIENNYCFSTIPVDIIKTIQRISENPINYNVLKEFPINNKDLFPNILNKLFF